jgi:hypothetical protein
MLDHLDQIVTLALAVAGVLWKAHKANTKASILDLLKAGISTEVHRIADDPALVDRAETILRAKVLELLSSHGYKPGDVGELAIGVVVHEGVAELARMLREQRDDVAEMGKAADALADAARTIPDAIADAEARGRARMTFLEDADTQPRAIPPDIGHDDGRGSPDPSVPKAP